MQYKAWSRIHPILYTLTLFSVLSPLRADPQTPISFSGVTANQKIVIDYQTVAESDTPGYTLEFSPRPTPLITVSYAGPHFKVYRNPHEIGSFALSQDQILLLDNLLTYYRRHDKEGGCTTQHFVTLSLMEEDTVLRKESYVEETGQMEKVASATPTERKELNLTDPPLLTFDDVIDTIYKHRKTIEPLQFPSPLPNRESDADEAVRQLRAQKADELFCSQALIHMPGYSALKKQFTVKNSSNGWVNGFDNVLYLYMTTNQSHTINEICWYDPLQKKHPQYDAYHLLKIYRRTSEAIASSRWLSSWKNASPGRSIELDIDGDQPNVLNNPVSDFGSDAWHDAGLKGKPHYEFRIGIPKNGKQDVWSATIYFGDLDSRCLVTDVYSYASIKPHHWLDRLKVSYTPGDKVPDYVVVARDGRWWRNERPRPSSAK